MIERNFRSSEGAKSVQFSDSLVQAVPETLNDAAGPGLPGPEPIEQKLSVRPRHARDLLDGLGPRAHGHLRDLSRDALGHSRPSASAALLLAAFAVLAKDLKHRDPSRPITELLPPTDSTQDPNVSWI